MKVSPPMEIILIVFVKSDLYLTNLFGLTYFNCLKNYCDYSRFKSNNNWSYERTIFLATQRCGQTTASHRRYEPADVLGSKRCLKTQENPIQSALHEHQFRIGPQSRDQVTHLAQRISWRWSRTLFAKIVLSVLTISHRDWYRFNVLQRIHLNYQENISLATTAIIAAGIYNPNVGVGIGVAYMIGRLLYSLFYKQ